MFGATMTAMNNPVLIDEDGPVRLLTLNDPERANPLSWELVTALTEALRSAAEAPEVRAVILTGAGRHFSAGADLSALRLEPTAEDIDALHADGYLGEAIAELQAAQTGDDAEVARDALTLLAGLLDSSAADVGEAS